MNSPFLPGRIGVVQEALAQLGDTNQLQVFWCLSIDPRNYDGYGIAARLARIGGWFALQAFDYLMTPGGGAHFERALRRAPDDLHVSPPPPAFFIEELFSRVVPNPPAAVGLSPADRYASLRAWIAEHRTELQLFQPTGDGVDLSAEACKDGKPRQSR